MNEQAQPRENAEKIAELEAKVLELETQLGKKPRTANYEISAEAAINAGAERLIEELKPYLEKYKSGGDELLKLVAGKIRDNPGASIAIAFAAGLAAGKLFERRKD